MKCQVANQGCADVVGGDPDDWCVHCRPMTMTVDRLAKALVDAWAAGDLTAVTGTAYDGDTLRWAADYVKEKDA